MRTAAGEADAAAGYEVPHRFANDNRHQLVPGEQFSERARDVCVRVDAPRWSPGLRFRRRIARRRAAPFVRFAVVDIGDTTV
jgi:hypothetical protein